MMPPPPGGYWGEVPSLHKGPDAFISAQTVFNTFRVDFPGESGTRNPLSAASY